jgi:L,D-peptidoglycan transpeptidase YkuD (ErfK/YbiS/YcfS/YnhG family)
VRKTLSLAGLAAILAVPRAAEGAPVSPIEASVRQLVVVRAPNWNSSSGLLKRYERQETGDWREAGVVVHVSLGRRGLAWGRGLHAGGEAGPTKHEGDGRSPAGAFRLENAFGYASALPESAHGFPYLEGKQTTYCVEDMRSSHYNDIIDTSQVKRSTWQRWSPLRRTDGLFRWGVVVRQNSPDVVVGAGSCVFLHVWRGAHLPTSGCTAMPVDAVEELLRWLDPSAAPVLVQLPETTYRAVAGRWSLPDDEESAPAPR